MTYKFYATFEDWWIDHKDLCGQDLARIIWDAALTSEMLKAHPDIPRINMVNRNQFDRF